MTRNDIRALLALAALAFILLSGLPPVFKGSRERLLEATRHVHEDRESARRRYLGAVYMDAIDRIRTAIPPAEGYLMIEGTEAAADSYIVRFDLAPRPCRFLGRLKDLGDRPSVRACPPDPPRYVVVARLEGPQLIRTADFFSRP